MLCNGLSIREVHVGSMYSKKGFYRNTYKKRCLNLSEKSSKMVFNEKRFLENQERLSLKELKEEICFQIE